MIDGLADITFGEALQLIVEIMLQERFGLSDTQLDEFVSAFIERLPISCRHALQLKAAQLYLVLGFYRCFKVPRLFYVWEV